MKLYSIQARVLRTRNTGSSTNESMEICSLPSWWLHTIKPVNDSPFAQLQRPPPHSYVKWNLTQNSSVLLLSVIPLELLQLSVEVMVQLNKSISTPFICSWRNIFSHLTVLYSTSHFGEEASMPKSICSKQYKVKEFAGVIVLIHSSTRRADHDIHKDLNQASDLESPWAWM